MSARSPLLTLWFWLFVAFLFAPLAVMAAMGFRDSGFVAFPIQKWTTRWYADALADRDYRVALWVSVQVAVWSTLLSMAVGVPTAFAVARLRGVVRAAAVAVVVLPAFLPIVVSAIALRMFLGRLGMEPGLSAIAFGHAVGSVPFVVVMLLTRLNAMSPSLAEAARNLGADEAIVLSRIVLPFLSPALFGAFLFCILLSFEDFMRSFFLGGFDQTFPVLLFARLRFGFNPGLAAISAVVLAATMLLGLHAERFLRRRGIDR
ncbi:MAG: ABC transporter permease [Rhodobacteraceae bacterium]|jgi:spermidine/putrescine transport system permease protein|nr:ABC transporter permease [Paracoccaceae bacterium]